MLALTVDSEAALDNLRRLATFDLDGPMGFYESIDFSRENSRDGKPGVVIYTYMAHHQGMSLLALDDALHHDVMRHRFHRDVRIRAVESLLFERMPTTPLPEEEAQPSVIRRRTVSDATNCRSAPGKKIRRTRACIFKATAATRSW